MAEVTAGTVRRQAFIQAVMARGCMREAEAKQIHKSLCQLSTDQDYLRFIADCNSQLEYAHFQIRTMKSLVDNDKWIGFVNQVADDVAKNNTAWPSSFTHAQLSFFKTIVERLATEEPENAHIDSISACNLGLSSSSMSQAESSTQATIRKLSVNEKQETLNQLAAQNWLDRHPTISGSYCIGIRTLLELKDYLLSLELPEATKKAWEGCGI